MAVIGFIVHLLSAATLLLFAVRFMRIGIERLWSARIRRNLSAGASALSLLAKGAGLGFALQGATVVMLMAAGLAESGTIPVLSAALVAMGADFGSAMVVQFLTLPVGAVGPLLILAGGWPYLNATRPERRNLGRVALGLGLIFLSLGLIREAVAPLRDFSGASAVLAYVNADLVTAAVLGVVLTLLMHSSLAAVLTSLAFAGHGQLGLPAGLAFVIGCNIGSALLPLWLLRRDAGAGSVVARALASLRIGLAVVFLAALSLAPDPSGVLSAWPVDRLILTGHAAFNLALLLLAPAIPLILRLFPVAGRAGEDEVFALPPGETDPQVLAMAFRGQVNRMLDLLVQMFDLVTGEARDLTAVTRHERRMNAALGGIRRAYAQLPENHEAPGRQIRQIMDFAIRIEASADLLSGKYATIRQESLRGDYVFSGAGEAEIADLIGQVRKGMVLAQNTFWREDVAAARELVVHKRHVALLEAQSKQNHLARVRKGNLLSLGSSDGHLELVAALKSINSKLATIGYAVLDAHGELAETRLRVGRDDQAG
ncbi:Na/Pi cotransporter family protein [Paracoccus sp. (in: a-proteobacteria)]|uniref:Na/Pi cotransporter family protein n=1 Tax=Paracoccus sp. TaxID=267 RepID=UPI003A84CDF2